MAIVASRWIVGFVMSLGASSIAQSVPVAKPAPDFTLTISQTGYGGTMPGNYAVLVEEKNVSDADIVGTDCAGFVDWLNVIVVYDGVRLPETDAVRRLEKLRKAGGPCRRTFGGWRIAPGQVHKYQLNVTEFYNMQKPGTYEVTVTKETDPNNPEMSTTVRSNTITIGVP
jgi:hypothetical protein